MNVEEKFHADNCSPSTEIIYRISPTVSNSDLNVLFVAAWPEHGWTDFHPIMTRSLAYICAYYAEHLIGFVNLAWNGGVHAFVLDVTVHPDFQRRGIGTQLLKRATATANARGIEWLHVDYEPHLRGFYEQCGFRPTQAGLLHLTKPVD